MKRPDSILQKYYMSKLPKYQGNSGSGEIKPDVIRGREFVEQWMNSPMYKEMLEKSAQGPELERISKGRITSFNIPTTVFPDYKLKNTSILGQKQHRLRTMFNATPSELQEMMRVVQASVDNPKDKEAKRMANEVIKPVVTGWSIGINPGLEPGTIDYESTLAHEYGHLTDAPFVAKLPSKMSMKELKNFSSKLYIPIADIEKMKQYDKGKNTSYGKYVRDPEETRQFLNEIRYLGKTQGIYDPYSEKITSEQYKKIKPLQYSDPMDSLREIYTDEQIIDMLNSISKSKQNSVPMAKNGGWLGKSVLPKFQQRPGTVLQQRYGVGPMMGDLAQQSGVPSPSEIDDQMRIMKRRREQEAELKRKKQEAATREWMAKQPKIGPADTRESTRLIKEAQDIERRKAQIQQNAALSQTAGLTTPGGYNPALGAIGAEFFANTALAPITGAGRLTQQGLGYNPYGFGESTFGNVLGGLGLVGDIGGIGMYKLLPGSAFARLPKSTRSIVRGPINYWEDPKFIKNNPDFSHESYINSAQGVGQISAELPERLRPVLMNETGVITMDEALVKPVPPRIPTAEELALSQRLKERNARILESVTKKSQKNIFGVKENQILPKIDFNRWKEVAGYLERRQFLKKLQEEGLVGKEFNLGDINYAARSTDKTNKLTQLALDRYHTGFRTVRGEVPKDGIGRQSYTGDKFDMNKPAYGQTISEFENMKKAGVDFSDPQSIAEYQATHIPLQDYGYRSTGENPTSQYGFLFRDTKPSLATEYGNFQFKGLPGLNYGQGKYDDWFRDYFKNLKYHHSGNTYGGSQANKPASLEKMLWEKRADRTGQYGIGDVTFVGPRGTKAYSIDPDFSFQNISEIKGDPEKIKSFNEYLKKFNEQFNTGWRGEYKKGGPLINPNGYKDGKPPAGSNWRIPGNKITMNLSGMPERIRAVPNVGLAKFVYRGEDAEFPGADYVDEYEMQDGGLPKFQERPGTYRPLNQLTDAEKRQLAQRVVKNARARIENQRYVSVPESLKNTEDAKEYGAYSCIGGVCTILEEEKAIPKVIWSNTEFAKSAPQLGFPNQGWGLKGIENLEAGDILQWMDPDGDRGAYKAYPHHAQIFLGINPKTKEYEFFDNFNEEVRSYSKKTIEDRLNPGLDEYKSQAQIYKINPYSPKTDPYTATNIKKEQKQSLEYEMNNLIPYEYRLRSDSPLRVVNAFGNIGDVSEVPEGIPEGAKQFFKYVNNPENKKDLLKKLYDLGYKSRATNEDINDSFLNVFGILEQENKLSDRWFGGTGGIENTYEKIVKPKSASIGPGQIKFNSIPRKWRKEFDINSPKDLFNWEKILPLMTAWDINSKQQMSNWGPNLSKRIIGSQYTDFSDEGDLSSNEFKWSEGRMSPYFYRGPGPRDIKQNLQQNFLKRINQSAFSKNLSEDEKMLMARQYITNNIRKEQKVFDPGSYGKNVWDSWARNIERTLPVEYKQNIPARQIYNQTTGQWEMIPEQERKMITLPEVIMTSRPSQRKIGGLTKYQQRPGTISLRPTSADSTALYLNALEKERFYRNNPKYRNVTRNVDYDFSFKNKEFLQKLANESVKKHKEYKNILNSDRRDSFPPISFGFSSNELISVPMTTTLDRLGRVSGSNVIYKAPDILNEIDEYYNPNAPVILFSPEIMPQGERVYASGYWGDTARTPYYEPLAVKPYAMRTAKEKIEWERKYGKKEKQKLVKKFEKIEDVELPKQIQFKDLPQPNVSFRTAPKMQMISDTLTDYSYTYPSGNQQKTIYFPGKSAWQSFVNQFDGLNISERAGSFSATPGVYTRNRRPNPVFENIEYKEGGWLREYQDAGTIMGDEFTPYSRNYLNNLRNEWVATYNKPIPYNIPRDDRFDEFYHEKVNTIPQYYKTIPAWVRGLGTDMEEYREGDKNTPPKSMGKLAKGYEWVENYRTGPFRDDSQIREYTRLIRSIRNAESRKPVWNRDVKFVLKNGGQHGGLDRWFAEKWVDVKSGKPCGRQEGESRAYPACRPSKRVSSKTPKTSSELSSEERARFKSSKTSSQRIPYSHKRRK